MNKLTVYAVFCLMFLFGYSEAAANPLAGYAFSQKISKNGKEILPGALIEVKDAATNLPAVIKVKVGTPVKDRKDAFYANSAGDIGRWEADVKPGRYIVTISSAKTAESYSLNLSAMLPTCVATNGYLNVTDCGATPAPGDDDTQEIKEALAAISLVQGGKLYFPKGIYEVGTDSGNALLLPLLLPFGTTIEGVNGGVSSSIGWCRINLGGVGTGSGHSGLTNKAIFLIGEDIRHITIRDIVLEATKTIPGSTGILAEGNYPLSAFDMLFSNMSIAGFDIGFDVKPCRTVNIVSPGVCRQLVNGQPTGDPIISSWQFDQVQVDHVSFVYNKIGVRMDTNNTDWNISSSWFYMVGDDVAEPTTAGLFIQRGGFVQINNTFAGGVGSRGGNFIYAANLEGGALTLINSQTENVVNSIVWGRPLPTPYDEGTTTARIVVTGSQFGEPIKLRHRVNFISTGNHYGANTITASTPLVRIYSTGDKFCADGYYGNSPCVNPGFQGTGTVVFATGQSAEGTAGTTPYNPELPNRFGLPVEISSGNNTRPLLKVTSDDSNPPVALRLGHSGAYYDFKRSSANGYLELSGSQTVQYRGLRLNGVLQFDQNLTYSDLVTIGTAIFGGVPVVSDGALTYCKDCAANAATGACELAGSGGGAFARRINGTWRCD